MSSLTIYQSKILENYRLIFGTNQPLANDPCGTPKATNLEALSRSFKYMARSLDEYLANIMTSKEQTICPCVEEEPEPVWGICFMLPRAVVVIYSRTVV